MARKKEAKPMEAPVKPLYKGTPQIQLRLDDEYRQRIEEFRAANGLPNVAATIRLMIFQRSEQLRSEKSRTK